VRYSADHMTVSQRGGGVKVLGHDAWQRGGLILKGTWVSSALFQWRLVDVGLLSTVTNSELV
jgi:hypothetical protein